MKRSLISTILLLLAIALLTSCAQPNSTGPRPTPDSTGPRPDPKDVTVAPSPTPRP